MPRGKNYVNRNRGVTLQAPTKKGGTVLMERCFYGAGCTRKDCMYRHDDNNNNNNKSTSSTSSSSNNNNTMQVGVGSNAATNTSSEPCMAYLAGLCTFPAHGCYKRHPRSRAEIDSLVRHYRSIPCRYGPHCKTKGCLYQHPHDNNNTENNDNTNNTADTTATKSLPPQHQQQHLQQPFYNPAASAYWSPGMSYANYIQQQQYSMYNANVGLAAEQQQQYYGLQSTVAPPYPSSWQAASATTTTTTTTTRNTDAVPTPRVSCWKPAPISNNPVLPDPQQQQQQQQNQPTGSTTTSTTNTTASFSDSYDYGYCQPIPNNNNLPPSSSSSSPYPTKSTNFNVHAKEFAPR